MAAQYSEKSKLLGVMHMAKDGSSVKGMCLLAYTDIM